MRKNISIILMISNIILILLTIGSVTSNCYLEFDKFRERISPFVSTYYNFLDPSNQLLNLLFVVSMIGVFISSIVYFKESKKKSALMIISNLVLLILIFILNYYYMYLIMMMIISLLVMVQIIFLSADKSCFGIILSIFTGFIGIANIYFLVNRLIMIRFLEDDLDYLAVKLSNDSRINLFCFMLYIIPCIILLTRNIIKQKKKV